MSLHILNEISTPDTPRFPTNAAKPGVSPQCRQCLRALGIPLAHEHLRVGPAERDAWLICMQHAIAQQDYAPVFADYLLMQLRVPAERVREASREPLRR